MSSLRRLRARYRGRCRTCNSAVAAGAVIYHDKFNRQLHCEACGQPLFEAQRHAPPRSTDQSIARREISTRYILVWAAVAAVVLFCIGLSSDRLWASTLSCAILCAICCSPTKTGSGSRALLLAVSVALLLVAAGSLTSDYLDGGLFDHPPLARCVDGAFSYSGHHQGTCSWHGGVAVWNPKVPWWRRI
jgi:hypothetical protein